MDVKGCDGATALGYVHRRLAGSPTRLENSTECLMDIDDAVTMLDANDHRIVREEQERAEVEDLEREELASAYRRRRNEIAPPGDLDVPTRTSD